MALPFICYERLSHHLKRTPENEGKQMMSKNFCGFVEKGMAEGILSVGWRENLRPISAVGGQA